MSETVTLPKSKIPIISYKSIGNLSKKERKLSNFFRCCSTDSFESPKKCFWSGNDVQLFKQHVQSSHHNVFCNFCLADREPTDPMPEPFGVEDVDKLIDHLLEVHGRRDYQCNRCRFRAKTMTHVQMHQISNHNKIWSQNNSQLNCLTLSEDLKDREICKIIVCKSIAYFPKDIISLWLPRSCPDLDIDLDDHKYYCLQCKFNDTEKINVLVHTVQKHRDQDICVYNKAEQNIINALESIEAEAEVISLDSEDKVVEVPNGQNYQPLVKRFDTKLSLQSNPDIPGLDGHFEIPKKRPIPPRPPPPPPVKDEEESNDNFYEDDLEDVGLTPGSPIYESYHQPIYPSLTPSIEPQVIGNHNYEQIFSDHFSPLPCPSASTPIQQNTKTKKSKQKKVKSQFKTKLKLKPNERPSDMNYRQYRESRAVREHMERGPSSVTSNPSTGLPPSINLEPYAKELKKSGLDKNTFKNINRVGVQSKQSAVTRDEDIIDDYINETPVPKRGIKARFEGQSYFELITPSNIATKDKNLYKCILCSTDVNNVVVLREPAIKNHLLSIHKTESSLKCGFTGCDFIGQKQAIAAHSKIKHPNEETRIEKFIIPSTQTQSVGMTSGSHLQRAKTTARKSTTSTSGHSTKGSKGALTQRIRDSTYLGPLKNDVSSGRKRSKSLSHEQYERVHYRGVHSSDIRSKKFRRTDFVGEDEDSDYGPSAPEADSDMESEKEQMDVQEERRPTKQAVAKKSTSKPSSESQNKSITLNEEDIPTKYFCVFCIDGYIINGLSDAIEHYKGHLDLGYSCNICKYIRPFGCVSYAEMNQHYNLVHNSIEMDITEKMPQDINKWIVDFLNSQITHADFAKNDTPNTTGIDMTCPLCVRAGQLCRMEARSFDALWKVKLHISKHYNWMPRQCLLCKEEQDCDTFYPDHPYLLMKHLADFHFTSCENLYNISFRGQKPYNEMKKEQVSLISRNFDYNRTSLTLNSYFDNLMVELDVIYEDQLKVKFKLNKEIKIRLERCVVVKTERIDNDVKESKEESQESQKIPEPPEPKEEVKNEDKKDIKPIKSEVKPEINNEMKAELKEEVKQNNETESNNMEQIEANETDNIVDDSYLADIYGPTERPKPMSGQIDDCIVLSSDDDD